MPTASSCPPPQSQRCQSTLASSRVPRLHACLESRIAQKNFYQQSTPRHEHLGLGCEPGMSITHWATTGFQGSLSLAWSSFLSLLDRRRDVGSFISTLLGHLCLDS